MFAFVQDKKTYAQFTRFFYTHTQNWHLRNENTEANHCLNKIKEKQKEQQISSMIMVTTIIIERNMTFFFITGRFE